MQSRKSLDLSDESLLTMIRHAVGDDSVLFDPTIERLIRFLSFDYRYNSPSVIEREVLKAFVSGYIQLDSGKRVSFTQKGIEKMKELNINGDSFMHKNIKTIKELENMGANIAAEELKKKSNGRFFWFPPEWEEEREERRKPVEKKEFKYHQKKVADKSRMNDENEKIDKMPPMPRKMT